MKKMIIMILILAILLSGTAYGAESAMEMESDDGEADVSVFKEVTQTAGEGLDVSAPAAILVEKETGTVLFEKNADVRKQPASVTKVMTILLIAEAIEAGSISMEDNVTVSQYASSMGGSQVFLEEGETMTVHEMLKSIVVASANDAAVAMAEYIAGSEDAFVMMMNNRAQELGMKNTTFCNCTGLLDQPEHLTTARDISIMSRELISHDWIKEYTTIWMDTIRNGEFGLSNTNKMIRYYEGATGLKTGFTSTAKYCISATAERDGVEYIAVVMGCETSNDRFESAKVLLSYGFSNYTLITPETEEVLKPIPVTMGNSETVQPVLGETEKLLVKKSKAGGITKEVELADNVKAPVREGDVLGSLRLASDGEILAEIPIVAGYTVERLSMGDIFAKMIRILAFGTN